MSLVSLVSIVSISSIAFAANLGWRVAQFQFFVCPLIRNEIHFQEICYNHIMKPAYRVVSVLFPSYLQEWDQSRTVTTVPL